MKIFLHLAVIFLLSVTAHASSWGLVSIPVACMRDTTSNGAELVSQALLGTPLKLLSQQGEWWLVETPDSYRGYMTASSLVESDRDAWLKSDLMVVTPLAGTELVDERGRQVSPLPAGAIVTVSGGMVTLPDGRHGFVDPDAITPIDIWGKRDFDPGKVVAVCRALAGAPYLWGGMSTEAMDCSGLVRIAYWMQGRLLPRDASQQALVGEEADIGNMQPGDLLFLDRAGHGRVTHVAVAAGDGRVIHCSGYVRENAIDPAAPDAITGTRLSARRTSGIPALGVLGLE